MVTLIKMEGMFPYAVCMCFLIFDIAVVLQYEPTSPQGPSYGQAPVILSQWIF